MFTYTDEMDRSMNRVLTKLHDRQDGGREICTDPTCRGNIEGLKHGHLSMPDPPGTTRLAVIAMALHPLEELLGPISVDNCTCGWAFAAFCEAHHDNPDLCRACGKPEGGREGIGADYDQRWHLFWRSAQLHNLPEGMWHDACFWEATR